MCRRAGFGVRDGVALGHDVLKQRSPGAFPERDALAHPAVERPEVLLDLAKVGEDLARHLHELLKAVLERGIVQQREITSPHVLDLGVDSQLALREHPFVGGDERAMKEARDERGVIRSQQPPGGMVLPQVIEGVVVELH